MFGLNKDKEKESMLRKFAVMYKFDCESKFKLEKCFLTRESAKKYVEALIETKDYPKMKYFLFEQSKDYQEEELEQEVVNGG
tara:strand:- start:358 stop:603 length:246 start_codon:yes stop_codon:yes gene_type:complete